MKRTALVGITVVALIAGVGAGWLWSRASQDEQRSAPAVTKSPADLTQPPPSAAVRRPVCPTEVGRPFDPVTISTAGVPGRRTVVTPPRDAADIPGTPPLTEAGKRVFAWDREQGVRPGDRRGNVLLNAHTWPGGDALGNELLGTLDRGDRIVVRGRARTLCYRVTEKVEVTAQEGLPRYYDTSGRPQLAIVVCSGRRLGPGQWENRTVWFASPQTRTRT